MEQGERGGMVLAGRRRTKAVGEVEALLRELGVTIVPFGEPEWHATVAAFLRFGRRRHAAALNFGDCLAYAAAVAHDAPLLFKGADFARTDVKRALD